VLRFAAAGAADAERELDEGISFSFKKRSEAAAAADGEVPSKEACSLEGPFAEARAHAAANGAGVEGLADGDGALQGQVSLASTVGDLSGSDWHM
jgi:hypothetical protein